MKEKDWKGEKYSKDSEIVVLLLSQIPLFCP